MRDIERECGRNSGRILFEGVEQIGDVTRLQVLRACARNCVFEKESASEQRTRERERERERARERERESDREFACEGVAVVKQGSEFVSTKSKCCLRDLLVALAVRAEAMSIILALSGGSEPLAMA